ncbi:hypothetical protein D3C73_1188610 [compost metagenome]
MLTQSQFGEEGTNIQLDDLLRRHLVIEDKHHGQQPFDDGRITVTMEFNTPLIIQLHHNPYLALTAGNQIARLTFSIVKRRQLGAQLNDIQVLIFPIQAAGEITH